MTRPGRIVFVGPPFVGHLNPLLIQAAELSRRGWHATIATTTEGQGHLRHRPAEVAALDLGPSGVSSRDLEEILAALSAEPSFSKGMATIARRMNDGWAAIYDGLLVALRRDRPDLLVVDYAATAAMDAAEALGLPFVVNNADLLGVLPPLLLPPAPRLPPPLSGKSASAVTIADRLLAPLRRRAAALLFDHLVGRPLNAHRASRALPRVDYGRRLRDRLVMVNSAFGLEYARRLPPHVHMTGPMLAEDAGALPDDLARWLDESGPVVYVSMGTLARPADAVLGALVDGLSSNAFRVLWPMRPALRAALPNATPSNMRVEGWLPSPLSVLRHPSVRAFLSHAGTNSVQESLAAGKPVVALPMFGAQGDMAQRVVDAGVGVRLDKSHIAPDDVRATVRRLLDDDGIGRRVAAVQSTFASAGGVRRAADLIERYLSHHAG